MKVLTSGKHLCGSWKKYVVDKCLSHGQKTTKTTYFEIHYSLMGDVWKWKKEFRNPRTNDFFIGKPDFVWKITFTKGNHSLFSPN